MTTVNDVEEQFNAAANDNAALPEVVDHEDDHEIDSAGEAEDGERKFNSLAGRGDPDHFYEAVTNAAHSSEPHALAQAVLTWAPTLHGHSPAYLHSIAAHAKTLDRRLNINDFKAEVKLARHKHVATIRQIEKEIRSGPNAFSLRQRLPDAPCPENAIAPIGWDVSDAGVTKETDKGAVVVSPVPVVIEKVQRRIEDGQEAWTVAWLDPVKKTWRRVAEGREVFASRNAIVNLAGNGLPVTTTTAVSLVDYLSAFQHANAPHVRVSDAIGHCGWAGDDRFVLGKTSLTATDASTIEFFAESAGEAQFVVCYAASGDEAEWKKVASEVMVGYPKVAVWLYGSLATVLLKILGVRPFVMHLWDDTSSGKTTTEEFALSAWGDPHPGKLVRSWESTLVAVERSAALNNDLPLALDEAQEANPDHLGRFVYLLSTGSGRGRGAKQGLQAHSTWRTICLSAGERALHTASKFKGVGVRVLTIYGSPFDGKDKQEVVLRVRKTVYQHHGHAGPRFVRAVLEHKGEWADWKKLYEETAVRWSAKLGGSTGSRRAQFIALLEVAGVLTHRFLELPGDPKVNLEKAMESLVSEGTDTSYARSAFDAAFQLAVSNQTAFVGKERTDGMGKVIQPNKYLGVWKSPDLIAFMPDSLNGELSKLGFDFETALRGWSAHGWLKRDGKDLRVKVKMPDGSRPRMVVLGIKNDGEPRAVSAEETVFEREPGEEG